MVEGRKQTDEQLSDLTKQLEANSNDDELTASILLKRGHIFEEMNQIGKAIEDVQTALKRHKSVEKDAKDMLVHLNTLRQLPQSMTTAGTDTTNTIPQDSDLRISTFQQCLNDLDDLSDASKIRTFVGSIRFVQVLTACGTPDTPPRVKSLAFMLLTKLFNPPVAVKDYPMTFIIEKCGACFAHCVDQGKNDSKLLAYRTLNAIFQTSMTVGSAILCQEGTIEEMMDVIEFETVPVQTAMAEVLSIASSDKTCRKQIATFAVEWLAKMAGQSKTDPQLKAAAGTTLAKLKAQDDLSGNEDTFTNSNSNNDNNTAVSNNNLEDAMRKMNLTNNDLIDTLKQTIVSKSSDASLLNAVEGLAYLSLKPDVKDKLGNDEPFLKCLSTIMASTIAHENSASNNPLLFGIGTIFANLTMYRPVLDEQQKQMKKLRDLANAKQKQAAAAAAALGSETADLTAENDPREDDKAVEERIKAAVKNGVAVALMVLSKNQSANLRAIAAQTYLNLVTPQSTRGQLLQQGIVNSLLRLTREKTNDTGLLASQALAKLAITTDPRIAFQSGAILDLVRPFLDLCKDSKSQLRQFEGLMALTNLASVDDRVRLSIEKAGGMAIFENLQLSDHDMVQRAATEMVCNMTFCEPVFERYSDPKKSQNKIRLLMILSDHEDPATRRAASGALAILANSPGTCEMILKVDKTFERMARWLDASETADIQHRGTEVIRCLVQHEKRKAVDGLVKESVDKKLISLVQKCQVPAVQTAAIEVLKLFAENGVQLQISNEA